MSAKDNPNRLRKPRQKDSIISRLRGMSEAKNASVRKPIAQSNGAQAPKTENSCDHGENLPVKISSLETFQHPDLPFRSTKTPEILEIPMAKPDIYVPEGGPERSKPPILVD